MTVILVCNTIRQARILPAVSASVALPHKKCSDDVLSKSLIALIATVDSAQVGLARRRIIAVPSDGVAQEVVTERLKGGHFTMVFAGAVAAGRGLVEVSFIAHGLQLGRHLSRVRRMNAVIRAACRQQDRRIGLSGGGNVVGGNFR